MQTDAELEFMIACFLAPSTAFILLDYAKLRLETLNGFTLLNSRNLWRRSHFRFHAEMWVSHILR